MLSSCVGDGAQADITQGQTFLLDRRGSIRNDNGRTASKHFDQGLELHFHRTRVTSMICCDMHLTAASVSKTPSRNVGSGSLLRSAGVKKETEAN